MQDQHQLSNLDDLLNFKFASICAEMSNIVFLLIGICQMYYGIEISHPVYGILFGNLIITLVSSFLNVFVFPFVTEFKYSTLLNGNNVAYFSLYLCCWLILSVLRYFYIVKADWLHAKFPNPRTLLKLACIGALAIFICSFFIVSVTLLTCGWPATKVIHMGTEKRILCISIIIGNFVVLLGICCILYVAILKKRVKLGENQIAPIHLPTNDANSQPVFLIEDHFQNQFQIDAESKELETQRTEVDAAIRSLGTNIVLAITIIVTFLFTFIFPFESFIILTVLKGLTPILSTVANFGKIRQLIMVYWVRIKETVMCF